jgi:hypothetical protein
VKSKHNFWGALLIVAAAMGWFAGVGSAHGDGDHEGGEVNETVHAGAAAVSDRSVDGYFRTVPNGNVDHIHVEVENRCLKGINAGPYKDPIDDCADVYLKTREPPVAEVEGRLGVGAMYWVDVITVACKGGGKGSGKKGGGKGTGIAKEPEILRADVEDLDIDRVLRLWDENSCRHASDETDTVDPVPIVYCSARRPAVKEGDENGTPEDAPGPKGKVRFQLSGTGGEPEWVWKITNKRTHTAVSGILLEHKNYEESVGSLPPDRYRLEVSCTCEGQKNFNRTIDFTVFSFKIKYPHGDPSKSATDWDNVLSEEANRGNELTFGRGARPAITKLEVACEAEVVPAAVTEDVKDLLRWRIEDIKDEGDLGNEQLIKATWRPHPQGDQHAGRGLRCTATFTTPRTGLPRLNSAFGPKIVALTTEDGTCEARSAGVEDRTTIEIFYAAVSSNHSGGQARSPNWFHYWMQVRPNDNVVYFKGGYDTNPWLITPAIYLWTYKALGPGSKTAIQVCGRDFPTTVPKMAYDVGEELSGIDLLIGGVIHEEKHVEQIADADRAMPASNGKDSFRFGWSWKQARTNHWQVGADGKWGVAGVNDDRRGVKDDALPEPPFEPGWPGSMDENLDDGRGQDWPKNRPRPTPYPNQPAWLWSIEVEACRHADANTDEHRFWTHDWAHPGKQHKTNQNCAD